MKTVREAVGDYLALRRSLGFKLKKHQRFLEEFASFLEQESTSRTPAPRNSPERDVGYLLRSPQAFARNWHFAAIYRSNFRRSQVAQGWRFFSNRLHSALAIYTKG